MSRIDVENAKQIRTPMDVLITMEVPDEGTTLTFSGYSSAKVADGELSEQWSMRLLADLQGNGFPLDGSRVLYDPNTTASATNGKIGVRSNIGQSVSVTVTGSSTIASLTIFVTGAESVTYNGTTSNIVGGQVIIPVGARSITLTFNPSNATDRIEVSQIVAGTSLRITNDSLIKCVVSLRSDLSIIEPTLPESELNVEVYNDADISEVVASLPEDTPITYQAGYPGDMSPLRKFYVSGQVTWADNVLSIHAVDAVHFLDKTCLPMGVYTTGGDTAFGATPNTAYGFLRGLLIDAGVSCSAGGSYNIYGGDKHNNTLLAGGRTYRDIIAQFVNLMHIDGIPAEYWDSGVARAVWITYVDAGIPRISFIKPSATHTIIEADCGEIKKIIERPIRKILANNKSISKTRPAADPEEVDLYRSQFEIGTIDWIKGEGAFINFDDYACEYIFGLFRSDGVVPKWELDNVLPILPADSLGSSSGAAPNTLHGWQGDTGRPYGGLLLNSETPQQYWPYSETTLYTQVIPWNAQYDDDFLYRWRSQAAAWAGLVSAGYIPADATSAQLRIAGLKYQVTENPTEYVAPGDGDTVTVDDGWIGTLIAAKSNGTTLEILPKMGYESLFERSNITGSFTWKGDPRMQPRDVVTWERLDGTEETITLENITLTHEQGGTSAEITYRKGIV